MLPRALLMGAPRDVVEVGGSGFCCYVLGFLGVVREEPYTEAKSLCQLACVACCWPLLLADRAFAQKGTITCVGHAYVAMGSCDFSVLRRMFAAFDTTISIAKQYART